MTDHNKNEIRGIRISAAIMDEAAYFAETGKLFPPGVTGALVPARLAGPVPAPSDPWMKDETFFPRGFLAKLVNRPAVNKAAKPAPLVGIVIDPDGDPMTAGRLMAELGKLPPGTLVNVSDSVWGAEPMNGLEHDPAAGTVVVW